MKKPRNMGTALNITIGSVALFLVVLPEPATTLVGLALLGYINSTTRDQDAEDRYSTYHSSPSYGNMVYKRASLGLETTALTKKGLLASPQIVLSPAYAHSHNWKHQNKSTGGINRPENDITAPERGLLARSRNTPYAPQNRQAHAKNDSHKSAHVHKTSRTGAHGELPRSWPNMPGSYHDNPKTPEQVKPRVSKTSRNTMSTSPDGQLAVPWPNMPETRFTR